jgi:hypothetical protein
MVASKSFASLRLRPIQAKNRSTTQRRGMRLDGSTVTPMFAGTNGLATELHPPNSARGRIIETKESPMIAKHKLVVAACALTLLASSVANAGPCSTQTAGTGSEANKASQEAQRQEHAQPAVAEQQKSAGTTGQTNAGEQGTAPSSKMTDTNQSSAAPAQGSTSSKMADQDC